ncbi:MAG: threonine synthase [Polaribacter sp.]|nr:threonine synthase [Polaribacter sp.]
MTYYSLADQTHKVSFKEAVIKGLAPNRSLFFPEKITPLSTSFFENIENLSNEEIALEAIKQFVGDEIPTTVLENIITETINFNFPTVKVKNNMYALELFHGPTMAFKDVGAKFMAKCLEYFNSNASAKVTVLVATSGDTGGAVANGFLGTKGVDVVILYPSGKVSSIQEKQLTTLGQNITALEVDGVFDDCQDMVKTAFLDTEINKNLTSANSINVARWLPQMFYYFFAYKQLKHLQKEIIFSVPSGNFGNICAGFMAQKLGLPIKQLIAATNANDTVPRFLQTKKYEPKPSIATISNAMDVSNPSNFVRIQQLHNNQFAAIKQHLISYSFTDEATKNAMKSLYNSFGYIADPHGAIGYLGLKNKGLDANEIGVFLETAHPVKFLDVVEETLQTKVAIPPQIEAILHKEKVSISIKNYDDLKRFLNSN